MKVFKGSSDLKKSPLSNPIVTLGNFDGVHLGHQKIFKKTIQRAKAIGGVSIVYTFQPHPLAVLAPPKVPLTITTFKEKLKLIESLGIDIVICENFTKRFSNKSPEQFINEILYARIHPREILVGHDYVFGKERAGSINLLKKMGKTLNFTIRVIDNISIDNIPVRSTTIRKLIKKGEVSQVQKLLGRAYPLPGKVIVGARRKIGFPTANLSPDKDLIPKNGVYVVQVETPQGKFGGVVNIGLNPTFNGEKHTIETHILNFQENLYGKHITLFFLERLRGEKKFRNAKILVEQIEKDIQKAKQILANKEAPLLGRPFLP